jgi:hypothetical protein
LSIFQRETRLLPALKSHECAQWVTERGTTSRNRRFSTIIPILVIVAGVWKPGASSQEAPGTEAVARILQLDLAVSRAPGADLKELELYRRIYDFYEMSSFLGKFCNIRVRPGVSFSTL